MISKVIIVFAAGGAAGKTTTRRAFAEGEPEEHREELEVQLSSGLAVRPVCWTFYDNCAVCGNHHSGADANTGPDLIRKSLYKCLERSDIAIIDGMLMSPQWPMMCNEWQADHPDEHVQVLVIHFMLEAEDLMDRLASRRGTDKETFRERMYPRCVGLVRRAELLLEHFEALCEIDWEVLEVVAKDSTEAIVAMIDEAMCDYFQDCEE